VTALRIVNVVVWCLVAIYMAPGAWSAIRGQAVRRGDPMRLASFVTAVLFAGFAARWLFIPGNVMFWQALYVLSVVDAIFVWRLARACGRGGYV
jgi:hypothetical protein